MIKKSARIISLMLIGVPFISAAEEINPWTLNLSFQMKTHLRDSEHETFPTGSSSGAILKPRIRWKGCARSAQVNRVAAADKLFDLNTFCDQNDRMRLRLG